MMKTKIDEFIRDVTRVGSIPKSEVRTRLEEMFEEVREEERKNLQKAQ